MTGDKSNKYSALSRRGFIKVSAASVAAASAPMFFMKNAWAEKAIGNYPVKGSTVKFGFNVPQTGPYADEGADEIRAYKFAVVRIGWND